MAFTGAATVVVAQTFILYDPNGVISAQLTTGVAPYNFDAFTFYHRDAATSDSRLDWSHGGGGNEHLALRGPADAGVPDGGPTLDLSVDAGFGNTTARLTSGTHEGIPFDSASISLQRAAAVASDFISIATHGPVVLQTPDLISKPRGNILGVSFHTAAVAASFNANIAPVNAITIAIPEAPAAGCTLSIHWTVDVISQLAAPGVVFADILVNGVAQNPIIVRSGLQAAGIRDTISGTCLAAAPVTGAAYNVSLRTYGTVNGGFQITQVDTILNITYYR